MKSNIVRLVDNRITNIGDFSQYIPSGAIVKSITITEIHFELPETASRILRSPSLSDSPVLSEATERPHILRRTRSWGDMNNYKLASMPPSRESRASSPVLAASEQAPQKAAVSVAEVSPKAAAPIPAAPHPKLNKEEWPTPAEVESISNSVRAVLPVPPVPRQVEVKANAMPITSQPLAKRVVLSKNLKPAVQGKPIQMKQMKTKPSPSAPPPVVVKPVGNSGNRFAPLTDLMPEKLPTASGSTIERHVVEEMPPASVSSPAKGDVTAFKAKKKSNKAKKPEAKTVEVARSVVSPPKYEEAIPPASEDVAESAQEVVNGKLSSHEMNLVNSGDLVYYKVRVGPPNNYIPEYNIYVTLTDFLAGGHVPNSLDNLDQKTQDIMISMRDGNARAANTLANLYEKAVENAQKIRKELKFEGPIIRALKMPEQRVDSDSILWSQLNHKLNVMQFYADFIQIGDLYRSVIINAGRSMTDQEYKWMVSIQDDMEAILQANARYKDLEYLMENKPALREALTTEFEQKRKEIIELEARLNQNKKQLLNSYKS